MLDSETETDDSAGEEGFQRLKAQFGALTRINIIMYFQRKSQSARRLNGSTGMITNLSSRLVGAAVICLCAYPTHAAEDKPKSAPAVTVETAEFQEIKKRRLFSGRIEAIDKIELRARVTGFLTRRAFEEGADVKKGALLFEIESQSYQIGVESAQADVNGAVAAEQEARERFDRIQALQKNQTASRATLSTARAKLQQAQAATGAKKAQLRQAKLNLSYTRITAHIDGRIGRAAHAVGDLIDPTISPLATLVSKDPMYIAFPVPQAILIKAMKSKTDPQGISVELQLADGSRYPHKGTIAFAGTQAASTTDSVIVRAKIANPDGHLVDQQLVEVILVDKAPEKKLLISQSSVLLDQQGSYVLAVGNNDKVEKKRMKIGKQIGAQVVVISGLKAGERIIISGHHSVHPGILVQPKLQQSSPHKLTLQATK